MKKINWSKVQLFYDEGHSWKDIKNKFDISSQTINNASKNGIFKSRSKSESMKLYYKNNKKKHTKETKIKIAKSFSETNFKRKLESFDFSDKDKDLDKLLKEIEKYGYAGTGRLYVVSDNAIRKRVKKLKKSIHEEQIIFNCYFSLGSYTNWVYSISDKKMIYITPDILFMGVNTY